MYKTESTQVLHTYYKLLDDFNKLYGQKQELLKYLRLPKFDHPNHWVNVDDILERLKDS